MSLQIGQQLGPYEISSLIGKGGMGEVFRAHDTKLQRDVALKLLPDHFANDPDRLARFQREAQVLAALNHPNIAQIYGLEESTSTRCIVMEFVEGETLQERLKRGPIPVDDALQIAKQICEALEAAHEKNIVHRDLKPGNVKFTVDGKVKVLDFGLAKALESAPPNSALSNSPTLTMAATNAGLILGTAAYMSPEQAMGRQVDRRTDIFAFGSVLYEMLTGRPAFDGNDLTQILARVLEREPDWNRLPSGTPASIQRLLRRALKKDPRQRLGDIRDARIEIEEPLPLGEVAAPPARPVRVAWFVAIVATSVAALFAILYFRPPAEPPEIRLEVNTPPTTSPTSFAISPDGRRLVFSATNEGKSQLWVRPLDSLAAQPLAGTDGAILPFWSPDSASVGFFADGKLKRIDIVGGVPQVLASATSGGGGAWNREDAIVFAPVGSGPLFKVPATGGEPVAVTRLEAGQGSHRSPQFLPDGRHFIYVQGGPDQSIYVGSLDGNSSKRLTNVDAAAVVLPSGLLLFRRQTTLFAQAFDFKKEELSGNPFPVAEQVAGLSATSGVVAYRSGAASGNRQLTWLDRAGKFMGNVGAPDTAGLNEVELSPDGKRVAVYRNVYGNSSDIWLVDTARGVSSRFTFDAAADSQPVWSPDGSRVVFNSNRTGPYNLYAKLSSGAGTDELLLESDRNKLPTDWSSDGRFLLFRNNDPRTGYDLWVLPMSGANASPARSASATASSLKEGRSDQRISGDKKPFPFLNTPFEEREGQFSPDGKWVAYQSNESGRFEIYVQPFPGPGGKFQISTNGGSQPRWNKNGKEIFYVSLDSKMMAAPVKLLPDGQSLETGTPVTLFPVRIAFGPVPGTDKQQYAVSSDGQRFLVNLIADEGSTSPIMIILNWKPKVSQ